MPRKPKKIMQDHSVRDMTATDLKKTPSTPVIPAKIECPQHTGHMLAVQHEGNRHFAVCQCAVRHNLWKGRVVWETTPDMKAVETVEETPADQKEEGE